MEYFEAGTGACDVAKHCKALAVLVAANEFWLCRTFKVLSLRYQRKLFNCYVFSVMESDDSLST